MKQIGIGYVEMYFKRYLRYIRSQLLLALLKIAGNNRNESCRIIFLIGFGRSGNTLLRKIINNNFNCISTPEFYQKSEIIRKLDLLTLLSDKLMNRLVFDIFTSHQEYATFGITRDDELKSRLSNSSYGLGNKIAAIYELYADENKLEGDFYLDKTPIDVYIARELCFLFPASKIIYVERDPVDAISSYVNSKIQNCLFTDIDYLTDRWVDARHAYQFISRCFSNKIMQVNYEDLVQDENGVVRKISDFIGYESVISNADLIGDVNTLTHHENVKKPTFTDSIGKGYKELRSDLITEIKIKTRRKYEENSNN